MKKSRENQQIGLNSLSLILKPFSLILLAVVMVLLVGINFNIASAAQPDQESEIQQLGVCYALGTDAIGRGNLQEGKDIYRNCFTQNAEITAVFPSGDIAIRQGTNNWANFVYDVFQGNGYQATQHLIGTVSVEVKNNQATMSSYLHATHKLSETSIDVANGTYVDTVIRQNGRWKISSRTLTLIDFLNLASPGASESQEASVTSESNSYRRSKNPHSPYIPESK